MISIKSLFMILIYKLKNHSFLIFLVKYTNHSIPEENTLEKFIYLFLMKK